MKASDLMGRDLDEDVWAACSPRTPPAGDLPAVDELTPITSQKTYFIHGRAGQFDFQTLPHGSYYIYVADARRASRLTRAGKEIKVVLKEKWDTLAECDQVTLAGLILKFFDGGTRSTHRVLMDVDDLRTRQRNYVLTSFGIDGPDSESIQLPCPQISTRSKQKFDT